MQRNFLKGFEDSFEVIGVNPSCFGDAFSEKLRKEERERAARSKELLSREHLLLLQRKWS